MARKDNINSLSKIYASDSNDIVIMYGSRYAGIHSVIFDFFKGKDFYYYDASPLNSRLQLDIMTDDIIDTFKMKGIFNKDFQDVIVTFSKTGSHKKAIVINNFTNILKDNKTFINLLISILRERCKSGSLMIVLVTEDISFIENDFYNNYAGVAYEIKSLIKVEPLDYSEVKSTYKFDDFKEYVSFYSVFGGNSYLWGNYYGNIQIKDLICNEIISLNGRLHNYGLHILPEDLREKTIYNTLLFLLAEGNVKLNDLYEKTGYDRAKISVYIKNLVKRGLVKKAESFDIGYDRSVKKGTYCICDNFTKFWYKFIFPNLTKSEMISPEKYYRKYIEQDFSLFRENAYADACMWYVSDRFKDVQFGTYYDKDDVIDFVGIDEDKKIFICATRFSAPHMAYSRLESIISYLSRERISADRILLISPNDFDQKLHLYSSVHGNVMLIDYRG